MKSKLLLIIIASMLFLPKINFGQAPPLGTAADYALFTSVGLMKNTGTTYITHITGNVGTNSGALTGFGNVDGVMTYPSDPKSMQAVTDVNAAYGILNTTTPTNTSLAPALGSGAGQILFAGVYSITNATITLDQTLILDAQNDPTKVFIFQLHGDFSTSANAKVKLINGAQACNVFWQVTLTVGMATGTSFKGTIIAGGAISLVALDTLEGRALTTVGDVNVTQVLVYTPIGCGSPFPAGPIAPPLASTACYTIFSSAGALTNSVGTSSSIGDVGNNGIGAITGWVAGDVTGTLHLVQDPSTILCASDLSKAYDTLVARLPDIELTAPLELGHSLVLTPHTYHMAGDAFITDTLILNAENNPNAVFIIQITGGNLLTSTYSNIKLINGAKSQNVYWVLTAGYVAINNYSVFRGTLVVGNGDINLVNTGIQLDGRAFSMVGAINTDGLAAVMPPGCGSAPIVITDPNNQIVCSGDTASFSVTATGTGLTYQWMKGNTVLTNLGNISGADSATLYIYPATISDTSSFYHVIVNGSYIPSDTSLNASLMVNPTTNIITQPINQTLCTGNSIKFSVAAVGTGLTYQWRKGNVNLLNGIIISGVNSDTLRINPATVADTAYNYNVIVSGVCGNDTSNNVSLNVSTPANIITQPINKIICVGNSVSFSTIATGTGLTYQWRKGIINLINGGIMSGATSATLTINPTTLSDTAYNYNVIVSGGCGNDTSINASLIINTPANITTQPANQTVCVGSSASFSAIATGAGLTYQWRKGIVNLINGVTVSGATSSTLTINSTSVADTAYNYNLIVSGTCGNDTSINVSLMVNPAANITTEPINKTVCAGSSVSFSVTATGTGLTYQWRKGIVNLVNGVTISGATSATLTINPTAVTDTAYNYTVIVSGTCGNDTSINASLLVNPLPPAVAGSNSPVCIGEPINLTAQAVTGATYQWTGPNGFTSSAQDTTILSATLSEAGGYALTVSANGCVSGTSTTFVVVSNCIADLSIVKTVNDIHPFIGHTVTFTITATNNGPTDATGVAVTDILQSGYTYVSSTTSTGVFNPSTGVWTIATLNNGASVQLTITATVVAAGNYVNTAIVYGDNMDTDMTNNTSTVETFPTDFNIPEGFSPNGDGTNDLFVIRGIENYPSNTFMIFNRWGNKVFEASPYQNTWNGSNTKGLRIGGDELPIGTYFYILDLKDGSDVFKGTIYLNK
jgi:gliding motility-associated-like protein/uncharacterized repeat protein (TIGR01451 family)